MCRVMLEIKWDTVNLSDAISCLVTSIGVGLAYKQYRSYLNERKEILSKEQTNFVLAEIKELIEKINHINIGAHVNFATGELEHERIGDFVNTIDYFLTINSFMEEYPRIDRKTSICYINLLLEQKIYDMLFEYSEVVNINEALSSENLNKKIIPLNNNYSKIRALLKMPSTDTKKVQSSQLTDLYTLKIDYENPIMKGRWVF